MDSTRQKNNEQQINNWKNLKSNQYIDNYYINSHRKGVLTTHNRAFISKDNKVHEYEFDQKHLLIDLGHLKTSGGPFQLIKLYSDEIKSVKLIKYHIKGNVAVFFFLHR